MVYFWYIFKIGLKVLMFPTEIFLEVSEQRMEKFKTLQESIPYRIQSHVA